MSALDPILAYVAGSDPIISMIGAVTLEVPRYTFFLFLVILFGLTKPPAAVGRPRFTVTAIIPCFNAEEGVERTAENLAGLRREGLVEIIAVNDGSTDGSGDVIRRLREAGLIDVMIEHPRRQGKSAAINHAARFAKGELILNIDADSLIADGAILGMQQAFDDEDVSGVSGTIAVGNADETMLTSLQALEYMVSLTIGRTALQQFEAVACLSGAFSMYRKSVFMELGGMDTGPGEDLEVGMRMRRAGHALRFLPGSLAQTHVPTNFLALARQRLRWDRDAYRIRINLYKNAQLHAARELGEILSHIDFLVFDILGTLLFPFYMAYLICLFEYDSIYVFGAMYLVSLGLCFVNLALAIPFVPHRFSVIDGCSILLLPLYQGIAMKIVRLWAYTDEILLGASRRDDFVPGYVREALYYFQPLNRE